MAKGEIAHYEQFLSLPECFQKSSAAEASESIRGGKGLGHKTLSLKPDRNPFPHTDTFDTSEADVFD